MKHPRCPVVLKVVTNDRMKQASESVPEEFVCEAREPVDQPVGGARFDLPEKPVHFGSAVELDGNSVCVSRFTGRCFPDDVVLNEIRNVPRYRATCDVEPAGQRGWCHPFGFEEDQDEFASRLPPQQRDRGAFPLGVRRRVEVSSPTDLLTFDAPASVELSQMVLGLARRDIQPPADIAEVEAGIRVNTLSDS